MRTKISKKNKGRKAGESGARGAIKDHTGAAESGPRRALALLLPVGSTDARPRGQPEAPHEGRVANYSTVNTLCSRPKRYGALQG